MNGLNDLNELTGDTNSVTVNLPSSASYTYDLNGNLLSDGTRNFGYDDENQLVSVCVAGAWSNNFAYDGLMRKRMERDYSWNGSLWVETNEVRFVYDGNLVLQERDANNLPQVTYTRGNDLSGTLQGAGGIGGLLARTDMGGLITGDSQANAYYFSDPQGNVVGLVNTNGLLVAHYKYDPFGNLIAMSGPLASANRYRFSSKEWNENEGLYYYGYRFYDPNLQRWPNRDPLGEPGWSILHNQRYYASNLSLNNKIWEFTDLSMPPSLDPLKLMHPDLVDGPDEYAFVRDNPLHYYDPNGLNCGLDIAGCLFGQLATIGACGPGEAIAPILGCIGTAGATWTACVAALEACGDNPCPSNQHRPTRRRNGSDQWANPG